jgi:uncharacterized RDD family membrane protein YckC
MTESILEAGKELPENQLQQLAATSEKEFHQLDSFYIQQTELLTSLQTSITRYAGFELRLAASLIDGLIFAVLSVSLTLLLVQLKTGFVTIQAITFCLSWLYYAGMESSPKQATIGKLTLRLYTTDLQGNKLSFVRASARYFGKIISYIILLGGYLMTAFTPKKQGLHDLMASCLVLRK